MNPDYVFKPHACVAHFNGHDLEFGRVDKQHGTQVGVKFEPQLTRHGWDGCTSQMTDITALAVVSVRTYNMLRSAIVTDEDKYFWGDEPRECRPPEERTEVDNV